MWSYRIISHQLDDSGNLVTFVNYYRDNVLVINNRPHSIAGLDNLKLQIQTILDQAQAADDLATQIPVDSTLPDLTPTPKTAKELAQIAVNDANGKLKFAQNDLDLANQTKDTDLITSAQKNYDDAVAVYKQAVADLEAIK